MLVPFRGKWRGTVTARNAGFSQRVVVSGAASGNGAFNGVVGNNFVFEDGQVELQWNDESGSGWQPSAIISAVGMSSPLVVSMSLSADDNFPDQRDGDFDDLVVRFEHLDAPFKVTQRPFALERGSHVMLPDGIFDTSQGVQYMGVRIRNTWFFDWQSDFPPTGMKIGIAPGSRSSLAARGIHVIDTWSQAEQQSFGQVVDGGFVRVEDLRVGEDTLIYFKIDVTNAGPAKPEVGFVAQRDAFDPNYDAPTRVVNRKIFITQSTYDKVNRELVTSLPEGTLRLKLNSIKLDLKAANDAAKALMACMDKNPGRGSGWDSSWWENCSGQDRFCSEHGSQALSQMLRGLLEGKDIDICKLQDLLRTCCDPSQDPCCRQPGDGENGNGWQDGTGMDGWCRVKPVAWLPISFDYKIEPNPAYSGQYGPLAFEDPWWKVILIILAVLLAVASVIYDYVEAGQDNRFIIGKVVRNGDAMTNGMDCAVSDLNGSRGVDLGELDAQSDDINNGLPIEGVGNIIQLLRTDNGNFGVQNAVVGNTVWKSGGRSGTTRGVVDAIDFATSITYDTEDTISGTVSFSNQVLVTQISGMEQPLSQGGDSGSVWVDMGSKLPVALNFAGPVDENGEYGVGNPIRQVVDQLSIRFNP